MPGLNKIQIIGNLGRDPEIRYTQSGMEICNFSVAVTEKYKDEERTEWFRVVAFGKLAGICGQYLAKGRQVYIEGRIQTRQWEDKDGNQRYTTEVLANTMLMLGGRGDDSGQRKAGPAPRQEPPKSPDAGTVDQDDDDLPF